LWFTRDHLAMAQALGWDRVASFYIDLEALVPPSGIPKPGPLQMHLPDDHMRYAIIWFSLAGLLLIAFAVSLRGRMPALPDVGVLAPLRHAEPCDECRLSGLKRKKRGHRQTVAIDPARTSRFPTDAKVFDALFRIEDRLSFQSVRRIEGIRSWARSSKPNSHGSA